MFKGIASMKGRSLFFGILGVAAALLIWNIAATLVSSSLIMPGPLQVARALVKLVGTKSFWTAVSGSSYRVLLAFLYSMALGSLLGFISAFFTSFEYFLTPTLTTIRSTPVLALILVAMFWLPSGFVPVFSAILMAFPVFYTSAKTGIKSVDRDLVEMSKVFKVPPYVRLVKLYIPSAKLHLLSGMKNSLGICWKVVVAGEILVQPLNSVGTKMQEERLSLETSGVFAWAIITILLCGASEFVLGKVVKHYSRKRQDGMNEKIGT